VQDVHQRARHAIRLLLGREAVLQLFAVTGGIVVARILGPGPLGVFGVAFFIVTAVGLVADLGMRTALIRQSAPLTDRQLTTCFTLQQALVTVLVALLFLTAPALTALYHRAPPELTWIIRLLAFDLYLRSWRSMSEIRLERELRYRELALSDVVGSTAYQLVAIGLVLAGRGAESLVVAMLTGNVLRTALLYRASAWPVRLAVEPAAARELVRVGVALQTSRIASLAPGWVAPALVGTLIGPAAVGFLALASTIGRKPLEILENVVRVSLPHFARIQHDVAELVHTLARYAVASMLVCGLWFCVLVVAGRDLVALVYTEQWLPAMPALLIYAASGMVASVRWLASAALVGIGRVRFNTTVSVVAAVVAIGTSALLVLWVGIVGVPLGQLAGIALATPWLLRGLGPGTQRRVLRGMVTLLSPMTAALAAGGLVLLAPLESTPRALVAAAAVSVAYAVVAWRAGPEWLRSAVREAMAAGAPAAQIGGAVNARPSPPN
jgi:O-antigen/teichoic acid export membrane protein